MFKTLTIIIFSSTFILFGYVFADHNPDGNVESIFNSKNGTGLVLLKTNEEVNLVLTFDFSPREIFDGYVYYNIVEGDRRLTQAVNFTQSKIPENLIFPYVPHTLGIFPFTKGVSSHSGDYLKEQGQSFIVIEKFSKALKFNGQCKQPFPEYVLVVKPDFSTGVCVTMDTSQILKQRGWY